MRKKFKSKSIIFITLSILFISLFINISAAQPYIGEDDEYLKEVEMNSEGKFFWTVYKNSSIDYSVTIETDGLKDWTSSVDPSNFVLSSDKTYEVVTLSFNVPKYPNVENFKGSISFIYRPLNSSEKTTIQKDFSINIVGIYEGRENTIFGGFTNPLPAPLNNSYGALLINIFIWLAISLIIYFIIKYILVNLAKKTKTEFDDAVIEIIRKPILLIIVLYGVIVSIIRFGINIGYQASLFQVYFLIVVTLGIYIFYKVFNEFLDEITKKKGGKDSTFATTLKPVLNKVGVVIIVLGGLIFGLSAVGIEVTALLAGAGVYGACSCICCSRHSF